MFHVWKCRITLSFVFNNNRNAGKTPQEMDFFYCTAHDSRTHQKWNSPFHMFFVFFRILWTNYKIAKVPPDMILEQLSKAVVHNGNNIIISSESYSYSVRERNIYTVQKEMCFGAPHHVINVHWQRHIEDSCVNYPQAVDRI